MKPSRRTARFLSLFLALCLLLQVFAACKESADGEDGTEPPGTEQGAEPTPPAPEGVTIASAAGSNYRIVRGEGADS